MEIEQEKFKSVKELAEIQSQIATGKATLSTLKKETEEYLTEREKQAEKRVESVLKSSKDALAEADGYQKQLKTYLNTAKAFVNEVQDQRDALSHTRETLLTAFDKFDEYVCGKIEELNTLSVELQREQSNLHSEEESLARENARLADKKKLLDDKEAAINRKIERFKEGRI